MSRRIIVMSLLCCLLLISCSKETHHVRYEISGSAATVSLTYKNATGGTEQRDSALPWSNQFWTQTWAYVSVTAFNNTPNGTVSCRLYVDNKLIEQATSVGGWKLASCGGLAGITGKDPSPTPP